MSNLLGALRSSSLNNGEAFYTILRPARCAIRLGLRANPPPRWKAQGFAMTPFKEPGWPAAFILSLHFFVQKDQLSSTSIREKQL